MAEGPQQSVLLRVKRRRDEPVAQQIVLEASSRASSLAALSLSPGRSAPEAGARKRCRFVLLSASGAAAAASASDGNRAATAAQQHSAASAVDHAQQPQQQQPQPQQRPRIVDLEQLTGRPFTHSDSGGAAGLPPVYGELLAAYLAQPQASDGQPQPQPQPAARKRPGQRVLRLAAAHAAQQQAQAAPASGAASAVEPGWVYELYAPLEADDAPSSSGRSGSGWYDPTDLDDSLDEGATLVQVWEEDLLDLGEMSPGAALPAAGAAGDAGEGDEDSNAEQDYPDEEDSYGEASGSEDERMSDGFGSGPSSGDDGGAGQVYALYGGALAAGASNVGGWDELRQQRQQPQQGGITVYQRRKRALPAAGAGVDSEFDQDEYDSSEELPTGGEGEGEAEADDGSGGGALRQRHMLPGAAWRATLASMAAPPPDADL